MSPIGRVFIIVNMVLAAVFVGYSAFYLHNVDSYKTQLTQERAAHEATRTEMQGQIDTLTSDLNKARNELQTKNIQLQERQAQIESATQDNADLKNRLGSLENNMKGANASLSTLSTTIENQNKRVKEMTDNYLAANKERQDALSAKQDAEDRLALAERNLGTAQETIAANRKEIFNQAQDLRRQKVMLDAGMAKFPGFADVIRNAVPAISAKVAAVNASLGTVTISTGEANAKVKKGYRFSFYDSKTYKGDGIVIDVADKSATVRLTEPVEGTTIVPGDQASTRLGG